MIDRPKVTLLDGTETDTWSPEWRTECAVRDKHVHAVLGMLGKANRERRDAFYASIGRLEGAEQEKRVREAVGRAWKAEKARMEAAR